MAIINGVVEALAGLDSDYNYYPHIELGGCMPGLASFVVCPRCKYKIPQNRQFTEKIKEEYPNAFAPWTVAEDQKLLDLVDAGTPLVGICGALGRQPTAVKRRVELLQFTVQKPAAEKPASPVENWETEEQRQLKEVQNARKSVSHRGAAKNHRA